MKVTTKGQVTIPMRIRKFLKIAPHSEVDFYIDNGAVVLVKHSKKDSTNNKFDALRGILKDTYTTNEWMHATRGD